MRLIVVAGAKGGTARTTTAVRLAEEMARRRIPAGIVDLSPYPTSHMLVREEKTFVIRGESATTEVAARACIKPYEAKRPVVFVDTGRLSDPAIQPWLPLCEGFLLTTPVNAQSIQALPAVWEAVEEMKKTGSGLRFLGFLPVMVKQERLALLERIRQRFPGHFLPEHVPWDDSEPARAERGAIEGLRLAAGENEAAALRAYAQLADYLMDELEIRPPEESEPAPKRETGMLSRLWKKAAKAIGGNRVEVTKEAAT
jgi:cellulose biosynthesis protein BcsQ